MSSVKNFLSGVESGQHFQAAMDAGAQHVLMSYLYAIKQPAGMLASRRAKYPKLKIMIDSGAHTLQTSMGKEPYKSWTMKDLETYVRAYAKWIEANRANIYAAVELDVAVSVNMVSGRRWDDPYGDTVVDGWRRNIFMPLQRKGLNIIYVWHASQGQQGWEDLCANFPYVGLPGEMSKNEDFGAYMATAKRYLTKVHGFAATKLADYRDHPWFSVDSITWKAGEIYGTLPVWNSANQRLKFVNKGEREPYRKIFEEQGVNADKVINDTDYQEVTRSSLKSMIGMELFFKERYKDRTYYYEMRLPSPDRVLKAWTPLRVSNVWKKLMRPAEVFPDHAKPTPPETLRRFVHALSCAQYRELNQLTVEGKAFLTHYFPTPMQSTPIDSMMLAKEISIKISPGNVKTLLRETEDDYADNSNTPKRRQEESILVETDEIPEHMLTSLMQYFYQEEARLFLK